MKTKPLILAVVFMVGAACAFAIWREHDQRKTKAHAEARAHELLQAKKSYESLELASLAAYTKYYFENPDAQFTAAKELIRLTDGADPKVWQYMDWGTYNAEIYARASLAAQLTERKAEADEFRKTAVLAWLKRKSWDSATQQMTAISPTPDFEQADHALFTYISRWDQIVREKKTPEKTEEEMAAYRAKLNDAVADEVRARRAQRQKSAETK